MSSQGDQTDSTRSPRSTRSPGKARRRFFSCLSAEAHAKISSSGGRVAHERRRAHRWTSEEARAAAVKGVAARARATLEGATLEGELEGERATNESESSESGSNQEERGKR